MMSLDGCAGLQQSLDACLSEGTCEDCQHFVGSTPGSIVPDFIPPAVPAASITAPNKPADTELPLCPDGMMPWEENPDCCVPNTNFIGDGACDPDAPYNIEACGYDGGDCCKETCNRGSAFGCTVKEGDELQGYGPFGFYCIDPSQGEAAINPTLCDLDEKYRIGDGKCDLMYNKQECNYDGGDCCENTCDKVFAFYPCGSSGAQYDCIDPRFKTDLPKPVDDKADAPKPVDHADDFANPTSLCKSTLKECPGGEFVSQDQTNNCKYFPCPESTKDQPSKSSLASSFVSTEQSKTHASTFVSANLEENDNTQKADKHDSQPLIAEQIAALKTCEKDLLECSDGTFVERNPNNHCKFLECPPVEEEEPVESIAEQIAALKKCEKDLLECSDGTFVERNPSNHCKFLECPSVEEEEPVESIAASISSSAAHVSRYPVGDHGHCTDELKRCSDGSFVSRDPNNKCEWLECPTDEPLPGSINALSGQLSSASEASDPPNTDIIAIVGSVHEKSPAQPAAYLNALPCEKDLFTCHDGSFVERDFNNGCKFFECPNDDSATKLAQATEAHIGQDASLHGKNSFGDR
jgi:hypothetical protein